MAQSLIIIWLELQNVNSTERFVDKREREEKKHNIIWTYAWNPDSTGTSWTIDFRSSSYNSCEQFSGMRKCIYKCQYHFFSFFNWPFFLFILVLMTEALHWVCYFDGDDDEAVLTSFENNELYQSNFWNSMN